VLFWPIAHDPQESKASVGGFNQKTHEEDEGTYRSLRKLVETEKKE
jgi:hypothetical protein